MIKNYIVHTNEFNFWYGHFQALHDLTLSIHAQQITALIGPSGCGKSTFLKCLNRINERTGTIRHSGSVQVLGQDIYHPSVALPELRKNVGMVFQKPNPLPLSIEDNILFGIRSHFPKMKRSEAQVEVQHSLEQVGLWNEIKDRLKKPALNLSLEKQQRLCIARLLPMKPKLLLLDEPCSALDPAGIEAVENLIRDLKRNYSVIIVTHSMNQAKRISDETIFMYMGEMIEMDETSNLFTNPKLKKTQDYIEGRFG